MKMFFFQVVGIKYYTGVAHPGEYVKLVREPNNPYDRNAIRVDNIRNDKVGHIKATTASTLAPIIDQFIRNDTPPKSNPNDMASIYMDGIIALQGANSYTLPLNLHFYSHSKNKYLSDFGILHDAMQSISSSWKPDKTLLMELRNKENGLSDLASENQIEVTNRNFRWESAQENLDQLFDQLVQDQLVNLPNIAMPNTIVTPLLDHQIEGIRWLYHHETMYDDQEKQILLKSTTTVAPSASPAIVPFYKQVQERGQTMWLSEITNATQFDPPKRISGSILYVHNVFFSLAIAFSRFKPNTKTF
jgi:SWI/SNF-related matrix-associated actin-dependent regulator of chromatin subfamily A3